ncbi:MAG TPA: response regulator transcription factor [Gammaproteobacteria bacterium]|jgi:DNA-binding NarL/FixJ family response regulator|nr:response regulator transcription factor [Gammaproteobacteria bacterium]
MEATPASEPTERLGRRLRTLLVGNNARFLSSLAEFLGQQPYIEIVGQARDGWEALKLASKLEPQLVLSDFNMEDMTGAAVAKALKARHKPPRVVVLSWHESHVFAEISAKAGADGYLSKRQLDRIPEVLRHLDQYPR